METFQVPLQGGMVACNSIEDAGAIRNADAILNGKCLLRQPN
jgi:hypothetical protein